MKRAKPKIVHRQGTTGPVVLPYGPPLLPRKKKVVRYRKSIERVIYKMTEETEQKEIVAYKCSLCRRMLYDFKDSESDDERLQFCNVCYKAVVCAAESRRGIQNS